jgi:hypothetical protein
MENLRKDTTGECIFCGAISFLKDEPCDCAEFKEARKRQEAIEAGKLRLEEICAPGAQGWREPITEDEYAELVKLLEMIKHGPLSDITAKLSNGTKIILKDADGSIRIERKEGAKTVQVQS